MIGVLDRYHELAAGSIRPLDYYVAVSFTKARSSDISWFTLDQSKLDETDLLADDISKPIQVWDAYEYENVTDRLISLTVTRSVEFPYNVQSAIADFSLNNYDGYLSISGAGGTSPLSPYIIPKRPCRLYLGFKGAGVASQFVGLTQGVPNYEGQFDEKANFTAMDFLSEIGDMKLTNMVVMQNARTDQVIAAILQQFGLEPQMYNLERGLNVIPFVYFESGKDAGNALRELIQAENGALWLDEQGVIRFQPRTAIIGQQPVMTFNADSVVSISPARETAIVNSVSVSAEIRVVQDSQVIFSDDNSNGYSSKADEDNYRVPANGTKEIWLNFDDPVIATSDLIFNGPATSSNFTAVNLSGSSISSGVSATGTLFATSYKLAIANTNSYPISISFLELWGQPAKMLGGEPTRYEAQDEDSIARYGLMPLEITDNRCFGSVQNARNYALDVLAKYSEYSNVIEVSVKGDPSLQLHDIITVDYPKYSGDYLVKGITHTLTDSRLETILTLRRTEIVTPFILDVSQLNGPDVLG